jgi:hypothetical protein
MGKSFIVACLALLACLEHKFERITVVVPNNYLVSRDKQRFAPLLKNFEHLIQYTDDVDFEVMAKHLILVDEADDLLYKQPDKFFSIGASKMGIKNKSARPKIICFTSTKGNGTLLWQKLLELQGYKELSYWPTSFAVPTGVISSVETTQLTRIEPSAVVD